MLDSTFRRQKARRTVKRNTVQMGIYEMLSYCSIQYIDKICTKNNLSSVDAWHTASSSLVISTILRAYKPMYSTKTAITVTMSLRDLLDKVDDYTIYSYYLGAFKPGNV